MTADARDDALTEIAAVAARLIAEDGLDYASAKRRAAEELLGPGVRGNLPDNAVIERELRRYLTTFEADLHSARLAALRSLALDLMERLAQFQPHLVGAVLNGTATRHSDLHLHLFCDSAKDVEHFLLESAIDFDAEEGSRRAGEPGAPLEELHFVVPSRSPALPARIGVVLSVHDRDAVRVAPRYRSNDPALLPIEASGRANLRAVRELVFGQERAA